MGSDQSKPDRKEQSSLQSKEQILEACLDLFAEKGYHGTSIRMIAKKAGVSEGLIYHHFTDKNDLFASIFKQFMTLTPERLREHTVKRKVQPKTMEEFLFEIFQMTSQEFGRGKMKLLFRVMLSSFFLLPEEEKKAFVDMVHEQFIDRLRHLLEPWLPDEVKNQYDSYLFLRLVQGAIMGFYLYQDVLGWKEYVDVDFDSYSRIASKVLSNGVLCVPEGGSDEVH